MTEYSSALYWDYRSQCFVAVSLDLPGCHACGKSPQAATQELRLAEAAWIEVAQAEGRPIPVPGSF